MLSFSQRVQQTVSDLVPGAQSIVVAVSGGADSVALLRAMVDGPWHLVVAHFDHGLRPTSSFDTRFVETLADRLGLRVLCERVEVAEIARARGWNLESAARRLRYAFLFRVAQRVGAEAVATGHTMNDQAETVMMQLLRGSAYLSGMPAKRGRLIRPLLDVSREEVLSYLARLEQAYCNDRSNLDISRTRAWLRHLVFPILQRRYDGVVKTITSLSQLQRDQKESIQSSASRFLQSEGVDASELCRVPPAVQREAIAGLLRCSGASVNLERIEAVRSAIGEMSPRRFQLAKDLMVRVAYGKIAVIRTRPRRFEPEPVTRSDQLPAGLAEDLLESYPDLVYRTRQPGDRIRLPFGSKKVGRLMIDRKVPREERDEIILLASGSEVLWIEGIGSASGVGRSPIDPDLVFMQRAISQARQAQDQRELPVGAVVVKEGQVLAEGHNRTEALSDPTAHAELVAIRAAAGSHGDWRLSGATLYVTLEPCPMCLGAVLQAHLKRVVFGASNKRDGALGTIVDLRCFAWKRSLEVRRGVLEASCSELLIDFFKTRRSEA
ncbi:MAG: tRNA lysidine(34) synthetase TilS [Trueperaceae bacterium]|nr:MAG: tRNA lysidine(34) synthetase TilS [Trueperaceae bacterium]